MFSNQIMLHYTDCTLTNPAAVGASFPALPGCPAPRIQVSVTGSFPLVCF